MDAISRQLGQCSTSGSNVATHSNLGQQLPRTRFWTSHREVAAGATETVLGPLLSRQINRQVRRSGLNGAAGAGPRNISEYDAQQLQLAARLADSSAGLTAPHPNAGCVLVDVHGRVVAETHQRAQGSEAAEVQAVTAAGPAAQGSTAYLNLETGDCHGDDTSVRALISSGVQRVVYGLRNPLQHSRNVAIQELRRAGIAVDVLKESLFFGDPEHEQASWLQCLNVNEALLHRGVTGKPLGVLKYAMTLDGKIATSSGHSAWVTSPASRARVFETRARSDAVIVGGQTVRRDNPRLTTRRENGHSPVRIVMSRTLDLPLDANLWDVAIAPTIVMTQRGARCEFQAHLLSRGVEVVQFDFLTPEAVASYCTERGFLQCLWECGGTLAAPAIAGGTIHKCLAFIAPKLIGGIRAPSPVGELGNVEMTQATTLMETRWEAIGHDLLLTGYLPSSGGPAALDAAVDNGGKHEVGLDRSGTGALTSIAGLPVQGVHMQTMRPKQPKKAVEFYKAWDQYGAFSNFSPHPIQMPEVLPTNGATAADAASPQQSWQTLEHYYQAQKFAGVEDAEARLLIDEIAAAASPEEAARIGRTAQKTRPHLQRPDWETAKLFVMYAALKAKFSQHAGPRATLLGTATGASGEALDLVESSPHDFYWGRGVDNTGANHLGVLLMRVRNELQTVSNTAAVESIASVRPHGITSSVSAS